MNLLLGKIGQSKYIEEMYDQEYLYFRNIKHFRSDEKDSTGRLDPKELNVGNKQINKLTLRTEEKEIHFHEVFRGFKAQVFEHLVDPRALCCSLHWIELDLEEPYTNADLRLQDLGDRTLLIYNWPKFFEILDQAVSAAKLSFDRKKVTYYDPKQFNGELSLHQKDHKFEYQNEYRIILSSSDADDMKLNLPGLQEISEIIKTKSLSSLKIFKKKN
jgi:hypothetical protein